MDEGDGWDLVAERVAAELNRIGGSQREWEEAGAPSYKTVQKFLNGMPVKNPAALRKMATFLGWEADAFERIRSGREPLPLTRDEPPPWEELLTLQRETNRMLAQLVAQTDPNGPGSP